MKMNLTMYMYHSQKLINYASSTAVVATAFVIAWSAHFSILHSHTNIHTTANAGVTILEENEWDGARLKSKLYDI
jgi:hypothetical protein